MSAADIMRGNVAKFLCRALKTPIEVPNDHTRVRFDHSHGLIQGLVLIAQDVLNTIVVDDAFGCWQVKIKRRGDDRKFLAQVLAIGTECDIALLTVEDEEFWQDVEPLQLGPLPRLQDAVAVIGYPIGTALQHP